VSYILDALRKSEQERLRGAIPNLLTVHTAVEAYTQPRTFLYGSIAIILIGVGIAIGWLRPWQQERLSAPGQATALLPEPSPRPPYPVLPEISLKPVPNKPVPNIMVATKPVHRSELAPPKPELSVRAEKSTPTPPHQTMAAPVKAPTAPVRTTAPTPAQDNTVTTAPLKAPEPIQAEALPDRQKVLQLAELPTAIQQEIPPLSIPVHTYSADPKQRIVGINGRLMQEGDYLAPDLKLEQITPGGVIFSYKSYRFRYDLP
jgi:general secretion pathway protein B